VRLAVVGHVEWVEFAQVEHVPAAGEIVHASDSFQAAGGGGAVAAVQLAKLAGRADFFTALGDDELGRRAHDELGRLGPELRAAFLPGPQRRAFVHLDCGGERTITVIGDRLGPSARDPLPWELLAGVDGVYFTAGDVDAVRAARRARTLVAAARGLDVLAEAAVELDVLVASGSDAGERYREGDLDPAPKLIVRTAGAAGGSWEARDGSSGGWPATPLSGPIVDAYGCGDSFAAGLTFGLAAAMPIERALQVAARCGAACLTGQGPYAGQLSASDI
jgi:ribokinase